MSGLIDSIVRRRRASASSRIGPLPEVRDLLTDPSTANGHADSPAVNGHAAGPGMNGGEPAVPDHQTALRPPPPEAVNGYVPAPEPPEGVVVAAEPESGPSAEPAAELPGPAAQSAAPEPGFRARARIRRRTRYLRSLREVQLRDLGGFQLELHRFGREQPSLVAEKLRDAALIDVELRVLEQALGDPSVPGTVRQPGIGGTCGSCAAVHGSLDRYCASCGAPLRST